MKILQFQINDDGQTRIGVLQGDNQVIDINASDSSVPNLLVEFLAQDNALEKLKKIASAPKLVHDLSKVQLLAPITKPDKVICIGLNYKEHCDETKTPYPKEPVVFSKFSSTIHGPYATVQVPQATQALDWEVELVVVVGKKAKNVPIEKAYDFILGYTAAQDLSARDWMNRNGGQFLLSKTMDQCCPLGPWIVTADQIPDPHNIRVKTWVNGVAKQNGNTDQLIHRVDKLVHHLSSVMTLLPGDLILTGTPSGVGFVRNPPEYLKKGDLLETEVECIGKLANRIV